MKGTIFYTVPVMICICLFTESKSQANPGKLPPVVKSELKTESATGTQNVNVRVKVTGITESEAIITLAGSTSTRRVIQIGFQTDPAAPGSSNAIPAFYFEENTARKVTYSSNSLYAYYNMNDYEQIIPKMRLAFKEGKSVWIVYSQSSTSSRFEINIAW